LSGLKSPHCIQPAAVRLCRSGFSRDESASKLVGPASELSRLKPLLQCISASCWLAASSCGSDFSGDERKQRTFQSARMCPRRWPQTQDQQAHFPNPKNKNASTREAGENG